MNTLRQSFATAFLALVIVALLGAYHINETIIHQADINERIAEDEQYHLECVNGAYPVDVDEQEWFDMSCQRGQTPEP